MRANSLMIAGGLIGLGASISNRAAAQKVIMLPDTYITGKLEPPPRSRLRAERLHRLRLGLEIVLLGTGARLRFPRPEILRPLVQSGVGVEVMDVEAACRTYNILVAEERKVAAALLLG